jgi:hypothetical protein
VSRRTVKIRRARQAQVDDPDVLRPFQVDHPNVLDRA